MSTEKTTSLEDARFAKEQAEIEMIEIWKQIDNLEKYLNRPVDGVEVYRLGAVSPRYSGRLIVKIKINL